MTSAILGSLGCTKKEWRKRGCNDIKSSSLPDAAACRSVVMNSSTLLMAFAQRFYKHFLRRRRYLQPPPHCRNSSSTAIPHALTSPARRFIAMSTCTSASFLNVSGHIFFGAPLCSRVPLCGRVPKVVLPSARDTRHLKNNLRMRSISVRSRGDDLPSIPGVDIGICSR